MKSAAAPIQTAGSVLARFATMLCDAPMMVWIGDAQGQLTFVNRKWLTFTGSRLHDGLGDGWMAAVHPDDRQACFDVYHSALAGQRPFIVECRLRRADNVYRWIIASGLPLSEEGGGFAGHVATCVDVNGRREEPTGLERTVEHLRLVAAHADEMIYRLRIRPHRRVEYMSPGALGIIGLEPGEVARAPIKALARVHPDDRGRVHEVLAAEPDPARRITLRWRHPDGRTVWAEHWGLPVFDDKGHLIAVDGVARDITRQKELEQQLRDFSAHLETAREEERRELARTLHDEVGQLLTGIRFEVCGAVERFQQIGTPAEFPIVDRLQAAVGLVDLSIATVQRVTSALRPPVLEHLGLVSAVKWEAALFTQRTGIRCRVSAGRLRGPDRTHTAVLYRILLEALTNVARHANAGTVLITLRDRPGRLSMEVRDNGKGIPDEALRRPGTMGLLGMRERARGAGGDLRVHRRRAGGTSVVVTLPVDDADRPAPEAAHA